MRRPTDKRFAFLEERCSVGADIDIPVGWQSLVFNLNACLAFTDPDYTIDQIKEKFGGLRYYTSSLSTMGYEVVERFEALSFETCEVCGGAGTLREGPWMLTLCDLHSEGRQAIEMP